MAFSLLDLIKALILKLSLEIRVYVQNYVMLNTIISKWKEILYKTQIASSSSARNIRKAEILPQASRISPPLGLQVTAETPKQANQWCTNSSENFQLFSHLIRSQPVSASVSERCLKKLSSDYFNSIADSRHSPQVEGETVEVKDISRFYISVSLFEMLFHFKWAQPIISFF